MNDNLKIWNAVKQPPPDTLKRITGGRLSGMTDIKPQWRYYALTEYFGPCGIGWKYTIEKLWIEDGSEGTKVANAQINLYVKIDEKWSEPIPGIGGSMLIAKEKNGLYTSDESYKMAVTDAISYAFAKEGGAADVYMGYWDGSKYKDNGNGELEEIKKELLTKAKSLLDNKKLTEEDHKKTVAVIGKITTMDSASAIMDKLIAKEEQAEQVEDKFNQVVSDHLRDLQRDLP